MSHPNVTAERVGLALSLTRSILAEDGDLQQANLGAIGTRDEVAVTMAELVVYVVNAFVAEANGVESSAVDLGVVDRQLEKWQGLLRQAIGNDQLPKEPT